MEAGEMDNSVTMEPFEAMSYEEVGQSSSTDPSSHLSFGYAIYTVFNIDHGMTRGGRRARLPRIPWITE
jgi:hypothetical protein